VTTSATVWTASSTGTPYRDLTVAVLGASGFIGRWVARALAGHGARLVLVARDPASASLGPTCLDGRAALVQADLSRDDAVRELLNAVRPVVVFNLAGYGVDRTERDAAMAHAINAELPRRIVEALATHDDGSWPGQRLVHVGSALEYGDIGGDLDERSEPDPTTLYGHTKLAGTRAVAHGCAEGAVRGVTARLFTVYGAGEHAGRLLPTLMDAARQHGPIPLSAGLQRRDFTYVEDVAEGLLRLGASAHAAPGEIVNLATGTLTEVRAFAEEGARVLGIDGARLAFGALPTRPEEMRHDPVSVVQLRRLVGWTPMTPISEGIRRAVRHAHQDR
jgi:nucleoside-diphosphate-sugar epimerase